MGSYGQPLTPAGGGDASGQQDLLVHHQARGAHDPVGGDVGVVGDLLEGGLQAEIVDGLPGGLLEVDAVGAAGTEDFDVHVLSFQRRALKR